MQDCPSISCPPASPSPRSNRAPAGPERGFVRGPIDAWGEKGRTGGPMPDTRRPPEAPCSSSPVRSSRPSSRWSPAGGSAAPSARSPRQAPSRARRTQDATSAGVRDVSDARRRKTTRAARPETSSEYRRPPWRSDTSPADSNRPGSRECGQGHARSPAQGRGRRHVPIRTLWPPNPCSRPGPPDPIMRDTSGERPEPGSKRSSDAEQQFPPSPNVPVESPRSDARTVEKAVKSRLHVRVRSVGGNCWTRRKRLEPDPRRRG